MAAAIDAPGTVSFRVRVATAGNDWQGALIFDLLAHVFAVVGFIGRDGERWPGRVEHFADDLTVVDLPAGYDEVQRAAFAVDNGVDFRRAPPTADADRLIFLPPFAPLAAR